MRARSIKPGFFKNENIAECSPFARLLFPGLWMLADREGKLEYRPKRIKAEVFPFDNIDVAALVSELEAHGLVRTYTVDGADYLWIVKFAVHQRPHQNEQPSTIPNYSGTDEALATKVQSACGQGSNHFALDTSSLTPSSRILDIPTTPKPEPSGHESKSVKAEPKDPKPAPCPPDLWARYLRISRGFHQDKASQLGARAPFTDAKVLDGAKALDTLIRIKGRPEHEVLAVLGWSTEDDFWKDNLRSIKALLKTGSNGDTKYANVLTAMTRDLERKRFREAENG